MPADPYAPIAALYDFSYGDFTDDVDFYENLARAVEGPLLELGVGSGRVALPLAEAGYQVTGIDASPSMLAVAAQRLQRTKLRKGRLELVETDMSAFDLGRRFGMVFVAANTFQHLLTTREQAACLACCRRHLEDGGIFSMSLHSPAAVSWLEGDVPAPLLLDWTRQDEETSDLIMKMVSAVADPATMVRSLTYVYDRVHEGAVSRSVFQTRLRYSSQAEIELLLQQAGLRVTHVYGDYDLSPVGTGDNLIFVARAEDRL